MNFPFVGRNNPKAGIFPGYRRAEAQWEWPLGLLFLAALMALRRSLVERLPIRLVVPLGPFVLTLAPDLALNLSRRIKSKSKEQEQDDNQPDSQG